MAARRRPPLWDVATARRHLAVRDRRLAALIERVGDVPFEITPTTSLFAALTESIVYQQLNGKAAATIHGRLLAQFRPRRHPTPADVLDADDATLRACGLSGAKAAALRDLAARTAERSLPTLRALSACEDSEVHRAVTVVRGIGPWTADMLLMFRLGRPDILPVGDYGVQQGAQRLYRLPALPNAERLGSIAEPWRPYRTLGAWYMWRVLEVADAP